MIAANVSDDNLDSEVISCEEYLDQFISISREVKEKLSNSDLKFNKSSKSEDTCNEKRYKLPKIQIKKFDGQLLSYLSFWGQFKKIHEDQNLDDVDKFHYLAQSMLPGTRAFELIESYPLTSDNYPKAISAFEERFGNKEILTEIYVRELLKLIIQNVRSQGRDKLPLMSLFDKIESHLRALESLGINQDSNASWLYPMVESCLSSELIRVWQRSVLFSAKGPRLLNLLEFLRKEVEGEQRVKLARSGFEISSASREEHPKESKLKNKKPFMSAASLVATKPELKCIFCKKMHESKECFAARAWPLNERLDKLRELKCCLRCLKPGHFARNCKQFIQCHLCKRSHPIILCPDIQEKKCESAIKDSITVQTTMSSPSCMKEVILMTLIVEVVSGERKKTVRCLLDCGSQRSYVLKSTAEALHLKSNSSEKLTHTLFGGTKTESKNHKRYSMRLKPVGRDTEYQFCFLDQDTICGGIPRIPKGPLLKELKEHKIWISDVGNGYPEIEILIGSDIYGQILTGKVIQLKEGLTAINTKLGWALCGEPKGLNVQKFEGAQSMLVTNLHVQNMKVSDMWDLEKIGIVDEVQTFSKEIEDQLAQEQFLKGLSRNEDGRYCVSLPWVQKFPPNCASNRHIAEKRLFATTRKLKKLNNFDEYDKIFKEWLSEDVVEIIPVTERNKSGGHYLPHHPVIKLDSLTSKIRPVFDASCKSDNSLSLNDCLTKGPNLVEEIPAILMRFREKSIGVTSDIRRAFLQISVKREDQNYLKFLWWENNKIAEFRHKRVVFGVTSSPYLLAAVISFHLKNIREEFQVVAEKLLSSFYVDNCVTSVNTNSELEEFIKQSTNIMAEAKMDLRMWTVGPEKENLSSQNFDFVTPVLGLQWDRIEDSFFIPFKSEQISNLSKRKLLSIVHSIFDPLGFIVPIMIPAKLMLQEAWAIEPNWDIPLSDELKNRFFAWYQRLSGLSQLKFPRRLGYGKNDSWSLHVFCDASRNAYATVVFLRSADDEEIYVKFVASKSRISPLKKVTIPRLELLACVLGSRLAKYVTTSLFLSEVPIYYWTDATVALCWIQREENWGVFVNNRVNEIRRLSKKECWRHIPGQLNPADIASRGCTLQQLLQCGWWEGPEFLKAPPEAWPETEFSPDEELIAAEMKKKIIVSLNVKIEKPEWFERFSSFSKILRVFCWMLRFVNKLRKKPSYDSKALTVEEKSKAEIRLWGIEQKKYFHEKENSVHGLQVVRGDDDVLRVKTKIIERDDELSFLYPVLLPSKHYLTECLIREYHLKCCHAGVQILAAKLRLQYWIISSKRNIRACVSRCVVCKRFTAKALTTPPIHLPLDRVRESATFEITGIDLCGPLFLKPKGKAWIVLFTCAVYRAVHLEPLTSLSTESFMQTLRRFIARRGRPSTVYTDNGTNFRGTDNALKQIDWQKITEQECYPIKWKFIPPTAAWWGGWWERLIRSVKTLLVRILGKSTVNFEELLTILCDVEATINSRPLTYVSDDSDELIPLTPSLFLQDINQIGVPDLDSVDSSKLNVRLNYCNTLRRELRSRFRKEYLGQLVQKAKVKCQELKVGDVVLIELDNKKRVLWPMGKIVKIYRSRDGASRVVQVKTNSGYLTRPIQKLFPLEVSTTSDPVLNLASENRSRYGRLIRPCKK